jgi:prolyl-tRNA editing enzyme YbaK/EbsC (Cys-tRNA(Pro) deacylase)
VIDELVREFERNSLRYELIPHRTTTTAGEEATVLGVTPEQVAKTLVLSTEGGYIRATRSPAGRRRRCRRLRRQRARARQAG